MSANTPASSARSFEPWMLSMLAFGIAYPAFVSLLIPPYIKEIAGTAADVGIVMGVMALGAVAGPTLGSFADKYDAHRTVLVSGVFGMAGSFALLAWGAEETTLYALDAIAMGVSVAAVATLAPTFVVGARLPQSLEAKQMTSLLLMMPVGQVLGGVVLALISGWSYEARFWTGAVIIASLGVLTLITTAGPTQRLRSAIAAEPVVAEGARVSTLTQVFGSSFGALLLVFMLSSLANNGVNSQIANILPGVYGVDERSTSAVIAVAGLLNIVTFFAAGRWMGRRGPFPVLTAGVIARLAGVLGMAIVGAALENAAILGVAFMQLLYQANPFVRLAQPTCAARIATIPQGAIQGWTLAATAMGAVLGSVLGGYLADSWGFNAINWMAVVAAGGSVLLAVLALTPAQRQPEPVPQPVVRPRASENTLA